MNPKIIKDHKIRTPSLLQSTLPLYTNIPTSGENGGKQAFEKALSTRTLEEKSKIPTWYLMDLLDLVLNGNIFEFNNKLYIQKIGTAMGTRVAPTYACLFMGWLEEKFLKKWENKKDDHKCESCDKSFKCESCSKSSHKKVDNVHEGNKDYRCDFCGNYFLKIVVRRIAYIQFMKATKITKVTLARGKSFSGPYLWNGRGILTISFSCGEGVYLTLNHSLVI